MDGGEQVNSLYIKFCTLSHLCVCTPWCSYTRPLRTAKQERRPSSVCFSMRLVLHKRYVNWWPLKLLWAHVEIHFIAKRKHRLQTVQSGMSEHAMFGFTQAYEIINIRCLLWKWLWFSSGEATAVCAGVHFSTMNCHVRVSLLHSPPVLLLQGRTEKTRWTRTY